MSAEADIETGKHGALDIQIDAESMFDLVRRCQSGAGASADNMFTSRVFLNASDSLRDLNAIDVDGKSVCTVGGSGDFSLLFANNGAKSVNVIDISPGACALNELKIIAARNLSFAEYQQLLQGRIQNYDTVLDTSSRNLPIFDAGIYKKIRHLLSEPTQLFFDESMHNPHMTGQVLHNTPWAGGLPLTWEVRGGHNGVQLYACPETGVVHTADAYQSMQSRIQDTAFSIHQRKAESPHCKKHDVLFLTNALPTFSGSTVNAIGHLPMADQVFFTLNEHCSISKHYLNTEGAIGGELSSGLQWDSDTVDEGVEPPIGLLTKTRDVEVYLRGIDDSVGAKYLVEVKRPSNWTPGPSALASTEIGARHQLAGTMHTAKHQF